MVLDDLDNVRREAVRSCIEDLDSRVELVRSRERTNALPTDVYEAFTTGNMHRIKFRKIRHRVIEKYLS